MTKWLCFFLFAVMAGCSSADGENGGLGGAGGTGGQDFSPNPPLVIGTDERPAEVEIPADYDATVSYPLVMMLHGRGTTGRVQSAYLGLLDIVDSKQLVLTFPNGAKNSSGTPVWNGAVCCAEDDSVDDVGYLSDLIAEAKQTYNIDPKRVYLVGHSNGGFMSFRMACEVPELFTALVSLAGGSYADVADCQPGAPPVSALVVHGTADDTVTYAGGIFESDDPMFAYAGAVEMAERYAERAGCDPDSPTRVDSIDMIPGVEGDETDRDAYTTACSEGLDAALWTMNDGEHIPFFYVPGSQNPAFAELIADWLFQHSR